MLFLGASFFLEISFFEPVLGWPAHAHTLKAPSTQTKRIFPTYREIAASGCIFECLRLRFPGVRAKRRSYLSKTIGFYLFFSRHEQHTHTHKAVTTHAGTCKCNKWVCVIVIVCILFLFIAYVDISLRLVQKKTFFAWRHKIRSCIFRQHKNDISSQTFSKVKNKNNATQPQNKLYNFSHVFRMCFT